jgi:hypothetical protein
MEFFLEDHWSLVFGEEQRQTMVHHLRLREPSWHSRNILLALKKVLALQIETVDTTTKPSY